MDYILEKFTIAAYDLATGEGDARSRIDTAYYRFWHIENEFPEELRDKRMEIERMLTRLPARDGFIIPDNIRRMKNKTASKIAELIFDIYVQLVQAKNSKNT